MAHIAAPGGLQDGTIALLQRAYVYDPGSLSWVAMTQPEAQTGPATAATTNVSATASSTSALASNTARRGASFYNDADKACYLKHGTTASTSSFAVKIFPNGYYELPFPVYTGAVDVIWDASPTGSLRVTEE